MIGLKARRGRAGRTLVLLTAGLGLLTTSTSSLARSTQDNLRLMVEVRDRIHRYYVEPIDSTRLVSGAIDGMVAALPGGENLFVSSADWAGFAGGDDSTSVFSSAQLDNRGQVQLLSEAYRAVYRNYVESIPSDSLSHGAIWGMLATLDPHSSFVRPRDVGRMIERFRGDFEGIGIYFEVKRGLLMVISPILGSPSDGKLRAGDVIAAIEGVSTQGITTEEVMKKLRGPKGSEVVVSVERQGEEEWIDYAIRRDRIEVSSVPYVYMLDPEIGYIRITRFNENTGTDLAAGMARLRGAGMRHLLLDLRQNGGGLLSQAVEVADQFVDAGDLIVYTEGRNASQRREFRGATRSAREPLPLVLLLDHGSASASEIVAGAVQDLDLGLIAGETSFGKGLVQEQFRLASGAGLLLLTVARYYTPLGRLIQRPFTEDVRAYVQEGYDDMDPNAVDSLRSSKAKFITSAGRVVYGGGGITPDRVLARPQYSKELREILGSGALFDFASIWVGGRDDWPASFGAYLSDYDVPDAALAELRAFLRPVVDEEKSTDPEATSIEPVAGANAVAVEGGPEVDVLKRNLKAEFARVLWGDAARYRVRLEGDAQVKGALGLFGEAAGLLRQRQAHYGGSN